jgi:hypothetical protein
VSPTSRSNTRGARSAYPRQSKSASSTTNINRSSISVRCLRHPHCRWRSMLNQV